MNCVPIQDQSSLGNPGLTFGGFGNVGIEKADTAYASMNCRLQTALKHGFPLAKSSRRIRHLHHDQSRGRFWKLLGFSLKEATCSRVRIRKSDNNVPVRLTVPDYCFHLPQSWTN